MTGLAQHKLKLSQLYPGAGDHNLNTCANSDCSNFGQPMANRKERQEKWQAQAAETKRLTRELPKSLRSVPF